MKLATQGLVVIRVSGALRVAHFHTKSCWVLFILAPACVLHVEGLESQTFVGRRFHNESTTMEKALLLVAKCFASGGNCSSI